MLPPASSAGRSHAGIAGHVPFAGHLERFGDVREKLLTPLIILSLTDIRVLTNGRDGFAREAFKHDGGPGFRVHFRRFMADPFLVNQSQCTEFSEPLSERGAVSLALHTLTLSCR